MAIDAKVISKPKLDSAKKRVKFAGESDAQNNDPFTKPSYLGNNNPETNGNNGKGMRKSVSLPQFEGPNKNEIATRAPSNSGFRASKVV